MKILVTAKRVLDFNVRVRVKADESDVDLSQAKMSINPFCEIAVEEAIRLKESGMADETVVVSVGDATTQEVLRHALALGIDRAIWVEAPNSQTLEPLTVAKILRAVVQKENPDLIIMGKQAIDDDCNQTGQMLAALLNWPQGTFISKLTIDQGAKEAFVTREIDGGLEQLALALPAVVTTDLRLNVPRYASLPNIMKAKTKPVTHLPLAELGVAIENRLQKVAVKPPATRKAGIIVQNVAELLQKLQEAQVL